MMSIEGGTVLIAVMGSSGVELAEGLVGTDPTALLRATDIRSTSHVIVLSPTTSELSAKEQAHVLIAARPRVQVAVLALDHHPLTLSLIGASVAGALEVGANPGDAVGRLRAHAARSRSLVWYRRAWGVREAPATAPQLVASVLPSSGFFREIGTNATLLSARSGSPVGPLDEIYVAGTSPTLMHDQLKATVRTVDTVLEPGQPWASRSSVPLTVLVEADGSTSGPVCSSCGTRRDSFGCAFCNTKCRVPELRAEGSIALAGPFPERKMSS